MSRKVPRRPLEQLRRICCALPGATERLSHGEPTWFAGTKGVFVMYADRHHDERLAFWCAAPEGAQEVLVSTQPARFFRPPYVGHRGWLGVWLDVPLDWQEIAELVREAYCQVASPRLLAELPARAAAPAAKSRRLKRGRLRGGIPED
jgi:predicted DNA-binding protein (MmcQ/YjbR family)